MTGGSSPVIRARNGKEEEEEIRKPGHTHMAKYLSGPGKRRISLPADASGPLVERKISGSSSKSAKSQANLYFVIIVLVAMSSSAIFQIMQLVGAMEAAEDLYF
ncbi:hypothetical protein BGZ83_011369 [Gryganskiella cystojenkinii]|nr:hypothetical protein BGZ83_011369 [Gryganskiella cystojenkinii]